MLTSKLIYQDNCNLEVLLEKQHDFSIYQRNLQVLIGLSIEPCGASSVTRLSELNLLLI